jgi:hypothetical protein
MNIHKSLLQVVRVLLYLIRQPIIELKEVRSSVAYILNRLMLEQLKSMKRRSLTKRLKKKLPLVKSFIEWYKITTKLDELDPSIQHWKNRPESTNYDYIKVKAKTEYYKKLMAEMDIRGIARMLKLDLTKNSDGVANKELYNVANQGTKLCIEEYHETVLRAIKFVYYYKGKTLDSDNKLNFFEDVSQSLGKTALFLSGGASMAKYHYGIIKALAE